MRIENEIDVYVVSYNHEDFICRNVMLSKSQNINIKINWYIGVTGGFESFSPISDDPLVQIISNISFPKDDQHMRCMFHLLSNYGSSRYKLILDPDFFMIQDNWVNQCITEIKTGTFGCIATQWHPSWRKQRWGSNNYLDTKAVVDHFFQDKTGVLLPLPTGQAIFFKK